VPVGIAEPVGPLTVTLTVIVWVVLMLDAEGLTVTDGIALLTAKTGDAPAELL
jgi:hypothetical protein